MRAKFFVGVVVAALTHEIKIEFREKERKRVGVKSFARFAVFRVEANAIAGRRRSELADARENYLEKAFRACFSHAKNFWRVLRRRTVGTAKEKEFGFDGTRLEKTHKPAASFRRIDSMGAENAERIGVARDQKGIERRAQRVDGGRFG
jgi:hypothetical protein